MRNTSRLPTQDEIHGDNLIYSLSGPSWLKLDAESNKLYGIPEQAGQFSLSLELKIQPEPLILSHLAFRFQIN